MPVIVDDAAWLRALQDVSFVRDYAIRNGKQPTTEIMTQIEGLGDLGPEERDKALADVMRALAQLVAPQTVSTIISGDTAAFETGRINLIRAGIVAVVILVAVTITGIYLSTAYLPWGGLPSGLDPVDAVPACGPVCLTLFTGVVLVYGACLGLIGAVAYELFHASGIVRSIEYGVFDPYRSAARVLLGVTFGWIFSVTVSLVPLSRIFHVNFTQEPSPSDYAVILLPFLVGYSSSLITGLLNHLVDGVRTVFGMGTSSSATETVVVRPTVTPPTDPTGRTAPPPGMRRFLTGR